MTNKIKFARQLLVVVGISFFCMLLSACGQKGPLYIPAKTFANVEKLTN